MDATLLRSLDLLKVVFDQTGINDTELAQRLQVAKSTISKARDRGQLSPVLAYRLAAMTGMGNPYEWAGVAAIEQAGLDEKQLKRLSSAGMRTAKLVVFATLVSLVSFVRPPTAEAAPTAQSGATLYYVNYWTRSRPDTA